MSTIKRHSTITTACVLVLILVVRGAMLLADWDSLRCDPDGYRQITNALAQHGVFGLEGDVGPRPTAFRPPVYPCVLLITAWRGQVSPPLVGVLHLVLGVATSMLVLALARCLQVGGWGYLAAVLVGVDPILLRQSTLVMTETLAAFLAVAAWLSLARVAPRGNLGWAAASGALLALAALCRPAQLVWLAVVVVSIPMWTPAGRRRQTTTAVAVAASLIIAPWVVRNLALSGHLLFGTTHGGYTLLLGNNEHFYRHLKEAPRGTAWDSEPLAAELASTRASEPRRGERPLAQELAADRACYRMAIGAMQAEPDMFLSASCRRIARLWGILPMQMSRGDSWAASVVRYAVAAWYAALLLLAVVGGWDRRRELIGGPWLVGVLLCFTLTGVHSAYWCDMRMRAPLTPLLCLLAAAGFGRLWRELKRHYFQDLGSS